MNTNCGTKIFFDYWPAEMDLPACRGSSQRIGIFITKESTSNPVPNSTFLNTAIMLIFLSITTDITLISCCEDTQHCIFTDYSLL